jgi:hypothetical protein
MDIVKVFFKQFEYAYSSILDWQFPPPWPVSDTAGL